MIDKTKFFLLLIVFFIFEKTNSKIESSFYHF